MKILIVRTHASHLDINSYNVQEIGLARAYVSLGHTVDIVMYGGWTKNRKEIVEDGINIIFMRSIGILKNGIFPGIKRLATKYDLIQTHEYDQITSWLLYTDRKLKSKVILYHGPYYSSFNKGYNLRCKIADKIMLKIRNNPYVRCYTKSEAAKEFLESKGYVNVTAVGVGLDTSIWERDKDIEIHSTSKGQVGHLFTYTYVGKIEPRRNSLFLMKLMDRLLSAHNDIRCMVVGDGDIDYLNQCMSVVRKHIDSGRLIYRNKVNQTEIASVYEESDCMLFPSIYEIFGMVLMEAMYFTVPVITSDNGGADMLYRDGENGLVIDSNRNGGFKLEEWMDAAERIYSDSNLRESIRMKLSYDRYKLGWEVVAKGIIGV